jgi:hypothetical protein
MSSKLNGDGDNAANENAIETMMTIGYCVNTSGDGLVKQSDGAEDLLDATVPHDPLAVDVHPEKRVYVEEETSGAAEQLASGGESAMDHASCANSRQNAVAVIEDDGHHCAIGRFVAQMIDTIRDAMAAAANGVVDNHDCEAKAIGHAPAFHQLDCVLDDDPDERWLIRASLTRGTQARRASCSTCVIRPIAVLPYLLKFPR